MSKEISIQKLQMRVCLGWLKIMDEAQALVQQGVDVANNLGVIRNARDKYNEAFSNLVKRANDQSPKLDITESFYQTPAIRKHQTV